MRVEPESKREWTAAAEKSRRKLSDWVRVTLDDAARAELATK